MALLNIQEHSKAHKAGSFIARQFVFKPCDLDNKMNCSMLSPHGVTTSLWDWGRMETGPRERGWGLASE
jgi:hypothetical protein